METIAEIKKEIEEKISWAYEKLHYRRNYDMDNEKPRLWRHLWEAEAQLALLKRLEKAKDFTSPTATFHHPNIMRNFCLRKNSNPRGSQIIVLPTLDKKNIKEADQNGI